MDVGYKSQKKENDQETTVPILDNKLKIQIDKLILDSIVADSRPFGDFSKPSIKKIFNLIIPGYKPPTRNTISRNLEVMYNAYKKKLMQVLSKVENIALTTDVWKARNNTYYVCVTGHFMDASMKNVPLIICFRKFFGRHFGERLKQMIKNELRILNIADKIVAITTDNASDIKNATSVSFGVRMSCFAHNLNLVLKQIIKFKKPKKTDQTELSEELSDQITESDDENDFEIDSSFNEINSKIDEKCESDGENNFDETDEVDIDYQESADERVEEDLVSDIEEIENENSEKIINDISKIIYKVRDFVRLVRKSNVIGSFISEKIDEAVENKTLKKSYSFILDFHVRWNSTYLMLERFFKLKEFVQELITSCDQIRGLDEKKKEKIRKLDLNRNEWSIIEFLIKILHPFYESTKLLSRRKYPTLSSCLIVYKLLSNFLKTEDTRTEYALVVKEVLLENLDYHLKYKLNVEQSKLIKVIYFFCSIFLILSFIYILASAFLDPIAFKYLSNEEKAEVESEMLKYFPNRRRNEIVNDRQLTNEPNDQNVEKKNNDPLLNSLEKLCGLSKNDSRINGKNQKRTLSIKDEISQYNLLVNEESNDFENFWDEKKELLPKLLKLVKKYSIIPGSSIASESAFSIANFIQRKERSSLSSKNLRLTILLREKEKIDQIHV